MNIDIGCYYPEHLYDERVHDALVNPSSGSLLGTVSIRKLVDPTTWIVGANAVLACTGLIQIEALEVRVTQNFASVGGGTVQFAVGGGSTTPLAVGSLTAGAFVGRTTASTLNVGTFTTGSAADAQATATPVTGRLTSRTVPVTATVATAVMTGGQLEVYAVGTPLEQGAQFT